MQKLEARFSIRKKRNPQLGKAPGADAKENKILAFYSKAAGEKLSLLNDVYKSEAATNTGNKALAALLLKYERIYADTLESVDVYTKQCSVGVTAKELAVMGATLANNGVNPLTGEQVIKRENVPEILATMTMAGLMTVQVAGPGTSDCRRKAE